MAYVFTLLALLAAFLWVTPAHQSLARSVRSAGAAIQRVTDTDTGVLRNEIGSLLSRARQKAMELLRSELHRSVDDMVR